MGEVNKPSRSCGGCTACCKTHSISDIGKPPGKWCQHCDVGKGCTIYDARPEECRTFSCAWLHGYATEADRPDMVKVVFDFGVVPGVNTEMGRAYEVIEGALKRSAVRDFMNSCFARGAPVYLIDLRGVKRIALPPNYSPTLGILRLEAAGVKLITADQL